MEIKFYYCELVEHTSFAQSLIDGSITIYVGKNETRSKEQLLNDLESTGLVKAGVN